MTSGASLDHRSSVISDVRFNDCMDFAEDGLFGAMAADVATVISIVDEVWYEYVNNPSSAVHVKDTAAFRRHLKSAVYYARTAEDRDWVPTDVGMKCCSIIRNGLVAISTAIGFFELYKETRSSLNGELSHFIDATDSEQYELSPRVRIMVSLMRSRRALTLTLLLRLRACLGR